LRIRLAVVEREDVALGGDEDLDRVGHRRGSVQGASLCLAPAGGSG
jgi:hypothetical protein